MAKSDQPDSLLDGTPDAQLDLPIEPEFLKAQERVGTYTGARLFEKFPEKYKAIIHLLAEGMGQIRIGKMLKVSPSTIRAVRDREGTAGDIEKKKSAETWSAVARLCGERMLEKLEDDDEAKKIAFNHLGVAGGIAEDKAQLLSGGVTARVETRAQAPTAEDFKRYLDSLPVAEAVDEDPAGNRLPAETQTQTREAEAPGQVGPADVQDDPTR